MTMDHAGYVLYFCLVIALALFLDWRKKRFLKTLAAVVVLIPAAAMVAYLSARYA
ncbi:MAG: hypothetical protein AB7Q01_04270 [Gammaproteobacteria bacterium]